VTLPVAPSGPDPEKVLAQALHAMAGGDKPTPPPTSGLPGAPGSSPTRRLSILQILLIAVLLGLCVGITAGLVSLLG